MKFPIKMNTFSYPKFSQDYENTNTFEIQLLILLENWILKLSAEISELLKFCSDWNKRGKMQFPTKMNTLSYPKFAQDYENTHTFKIQLLILLEKLI